MNEPTTAAGLDALQSLCHFDPCAGLKGPNPARALGVERLRRALYNAAVRSTWSNAAAVALANDTAREYAKEPQP